MNERVQGGVGPAALGLALVSGLVSLATALSSGSSWLWLSSALISALSLVTVAMWSWTLQRQAQARARELSSLRSVLEVLPLGVVANREGRAVYANVATLRILGLERIEDILGRRLVDFVHPEELQQSEQRAEAWTRGSTPPPRRVRLRTPRGELMVDTIPLEQTVQIDGQPAKLAVLQQVTDREGLERSLLRQAGFAAATSELSRELAEARFDLQRILDSVVRLSVTRDAEGAMVRLWSRDGKSVTRGVASFSRDPQLLERAGQVQARGSTATDDRLRQTASALVVSKDRILAALTPEMRGLLESQVPQHVAIVPLRGQGRVLGSLSVGRHRDEPFDTDELQYLQDLADRAGQALINVELYDDVSQALDKLKNTEAQLRHSQRLEALGHLAGGIAHDFNNLLSVILSLSAALLAERTEDDPIRPDLADIQAAGTRAAELTQQLLAFSRKQVMQLKAIDVNRTLGTAESLLRRLVGEDITLTVELGTELPLVKVDPSLLTQVLMNLVVNARDAMPRGGTLAITTTLHTVKDGEGPSELTPGRYVCMSVRDSGVGIAPEVKEHLFEPFFTTKARGKGTGLGLSTSYGIARQSGGTMTFSSEQGAGATFVLWLQEHQGAVAVTTTPKPEVSKATRRGTVFLVEDEPRVRDVAVRLLERAGYQVHSAVSAEDALARHESLGGFDMLLTDVVMPGQSGRELADALVKLRPGLRVLFMSGYTDDEILRRGALDGRLTLLQKPFTPESLVQAVDAVFAA